MALSVNSFSVRQLAPMAAILLLAIYTTAAAEPAPAPAVMDAAEIQLALARLNVLGRVLYVAAHPDDENTGLIAYFANGALYDTAYLSLTRGDGGQNLIGSELREKLGLIRTQELLAARRIDHGKQFFTRANDFGFSKSAEETLRIWDRDKILADVVWTIRKYRPDVIVTRFAPDDNRTHGHHTASAILAGEAFRAAADPKRFPEQLEYAAPWQAKRIVWNTSRFFFADRDQSFDTKGLVTLDISGFQPLLGKSYAEIAAASRSMHKSQGFGAGIDRNPQPAYFKFTDGEPMQGGLFDGVDATWARVPGAAAVSEKLRAAQAAYAPANPATSVPALLEARRALRELTKDPWAAAKLTELDGIIAACLGLRLEVITEKPTARPGEPLPLQVEAINRSPVPVNLHSVRLSASDDPVAPIDAPLAESRYFTKKIALQLPAINNYSQPYWLVDPGTTGTYQVNHQMLIGLPETGGRSVIAALEIGGEEILYRLPLRSRRVDPVAGELTEPLTITPPVFIELPRPVFVFGDTAPKTLEVRAVASADKYEGELTLEAPEGWRVEPASVFIELKGSDAEKVFPFKVTPPAFDSEGKLRAALTSNAGQRQPAFGRQRIAYPHIDPQTYVSPAESRLVRADIRSTARRVGYLPGAGDDLPDCLRQIGVEVKTLDSYNLRTSDLAGLDAVVIGVRAQNVQPALFAAWQPALRAYAEAGGAVVVQYNTAPGPGAGDLPFPLRVSHDRVTDETAAMQILAPDHPALIAPNRIGEGDFADWVQERGLYFPDQWDAAWTPLLACHDPGEKPLQGGLLAARVGKGYYIYTGYSWFRELPAGVPGAYRIFANLISLGKVPASAPPP